MKDHLSIVVKHEKLDTNHHDLWKTSVDTTAEECEPNDTHQLYDCHMVGKEVGVTQHRARGLSPLSLKTQVEDKNGERKEAEDACHGKGCGDRSTNWGVKAPVQVINNAHRGRKGRGRKGSIGRGVDGHDCGRRGRDRV